MTSFGFRGKHSLEYDSIRGDSIIHSPEHDVKYYFIQREHPIVFINTSSHSMAEYDANHSLWKWEYILWLENSPLVLGDKNRNHIEAENEEKITKEMKINPFYLDIFLRWHKSIEK